MLPADWVLLRLVRRAVMSAGTIPTGGAVTIALHGGREIGPPLFYKILRQLGITQEQFQSLR